MKDLNSNDKHRGLMGAIQQLFTEKTLKSLKNLAPMKVSKVEKGVISIIIPALNASNHLENLLPSLNHQTYQKFEVIINNDKKTSDNTKEIVNKYSKSFKITLLQRDNHVTLGRQAASVYAKGEYLLHLDTDMKLSPQVLEQCIKKITDY
ncbi:MAG: glycosyltransferase family 2 protein, partial [Chitinophagaceae bacterium]